MKKVSTAALILVFILSAALTVSASDIVLTENGELQMEDLSEIILQPDDVIVTEETIDSYLDIMKEDLADLEGTSLDEVTDELIRKYSELYFGQPLDSVEDARDYIRSTQEESNARNALITALKDKATVLSYPQDIYEMASAYVADEIAYYALQEELEQDELAILSGFGSAKDYIKTQAEDYVVTSMIVDRVLEEEGILYSDEERDKALQRYMQDLGYDAYTSLEEFKETAGETWLWLFTEFHYKSDLVYEAMKDRIRIAE